MGKKVYEVGYCVAACGKPVETWIEVPGEGFHGFCIACARAHNEHLAFVRLRQGRPESPVKREPLESPFDVESVLPFSVPNEE